MFKYSLTFLLTFLLVLGPVPSFAKERPLNKGEFPDGTVVLWMCEGRSNVKFMLVLPNKQTYQAELLCGEQV